MYFSICRKSLEESHRRFSIISPSYRYILIIMWDFWIYYIEENLYIEAHTNGVQQKNRIIHNDNWGARSIYVCMYVRWTTKKITWEVHKHIISIFYYGHYYHDYCQDANKGNKKWWTISNWNLFIHAALTNKIAASEQRCSQQHISKTISHLAPCSMRWRMNI